MVAASPLRDNRNGLCDRSLTTQFAITRVRVVVEPIRFPLPVVSTRRRHCESSLCDR
jgi:hypothetical protein